MISTPLKVATVTAAAALLALLLAGVAYVARGEGAPAARRRVLAAAGAPLVAWAGLVAAAVAGGWLEAGRGTTFPAIALAIAAPPALVSPLAAVTAFRRRLDRVPAHWLVGVQLYRVAGVLFLLAYLEGGLPAEFALPAAVGDMLVGAAAPLVARALARSGGRARTAAVWWNALGTADLVVAVTLGVLTSPSAFQQLALGDPNAAITRFPLVLIPAFAVPVSLLLHGFALARLRPRPALRGAGAPAAGAGAGAA